MGNGSNTYAQRFEVLVIAQRPGTWWSRLAEIGITAYCLPSQRWASLRQQVQSFAAYLRAQQIDLLVVNIGIDNRLPMLALHLLPNSMPVALVLHNDRPEVYDLAIVNAAAWNCAVGVSPKVLQIAQRRFPQKDIRWIPYGVALPTTQRLCERMGWSTPLRLLFVGRLDDEQKGIFRLPDIVRGCRDQGVDVHLTVIGDGPDRQRLLQACQADDIANWIDWVGFQPSQEVLAQMRAHHLLILPSNYEGLPIVVLEAQANGCVPICSQLPGITDAMITEGLTGKMIAPTDLNGFVDAIRSFATPADWYTYSQASIDQAQHHYSMQRMAEQYLALFDILGHGGHPLTVPRSQLQRQDITPLRRRDALPQPLRRLGTTLKRCK